LPPLHVRAQSQLFPRVERTPKLSVPEEVL
jgi:hypothetical protein